MEDGWLFIGSAPAAQQGRGSQCVGIVLSPLAAKALDEKHVDLGPRVVAVRLLTTGQGGPTAWCCCKAAWSATHLRIFYAAHLVCAGSGQKLRWHD